MNTDIVWMAGYLCTCKSRVRQGYNTVYMHSKRLSNSMLHFIVEHDVRTLNFVGHHGEYTYAFSSLKVFHVDVVT